MYCKEPASKKQKINCESNESETFTQYTQDHHNIALIENDLPEELPTTQPSKSPILENKDRSFKKSLNSCSVLKRLSRFPRTVLGDNVVESKFFNSTSTYESTSSDQKDLSRSIVIEESPEKPSKNPFKVNSPDCNRTILVDTQCVDTQDTQSESYQKENSYQTSPRSSRNPFKIKSPDCNRTVLVDTQHIDTHDTQSESSQKENSYQTLPMSSKNPFKVISPDCNRTLLIDTQCIDTEDTQLESSQKENSPQNSPIKKESPILKSSPLRSSFKLKAELVQSVMDHLTEDSVIDNTYPLEELVTPVDSQVCSFIIYKLCS